MLQGAGAATPTLYSSAGSDNNSAPTAQPCPAQWPANKQWPGFLAGSPVSRRHSSLMLSILNEAERAELEDVFDALSNDCEQGVVTVRHVARALEHTLGAEHSSDKMAKAAHELMGANFNGQLDRAAFRAFMLSHWSMSSKPADTAGNRITEVPVSAQARLVEVMRLYHRKTLAERTFKRAHVQVRQLHEVGGISLDSAALPSLTGLQKSTTRRRSALGLSAAPGSTSNCDAASIAQDIPHAKSLKRSEGGVPIDVPRSRSCAAMQAPAVDGSGSVAPLSRFRRASLRLIEAALAAERQPAPQFDHHTTRPSGQPQSGPTTGLQQSLSASQPKSAPGTRREACDGSGLGEGGIIGTACESSNNEPWQTDQAVLASTLQLAQLSEAATALDAAPEAGGAMAEASGMLAESRTTKQDDCPSTSQEPQPLSPPASATLIAEPPSTPRSCCSARHPKRRDSRASAVMFATLLDSNSDMDASLYASAECSGSLYTSAQDLAGADTEGGTGTAELSYPIAERSAVRHSMPQAGCSSRPRSPWAEVRAAALASDEPECEPEPESALDERKKLTMSWIGRRLTRFLFKQADIHRFEDSSSEVGSTQASVHSYRRRSEEFLARRAELSRPGSSGRLAMWPQPTQPMPGFPAPPGTYMPPGQMHGPGHSVGPLVPNRMPEKAKANALTTDRAIKDLQYLRKQRLGLSRDRWQ